MQGDMKVIKDSQDNMSGSVTQGTRAGKLLFALGSTYSRCEADGRMCHHVMQVLQSDKEQNFSNMVAGDESSFFL
jgi:hypothetical protein